MLKNAINNISLDFKIEAVNSPTLMKDMAAMENYMAESYGERIFIELLQNADDAGSSIINMFTHGDYLIFANNGRAFNEEDVKGISRSGASGKKRGKSIGYRGIGFKSTSYISSEILIYSNDTFFTYSKKRCAFELKVNEEDVPTIRIPFVVNECELNDEVIEVKQELIEKGYSTIFIFSNPNLELIEEELKLVNNGYFLFLNNVNSVNINTVETKVEFEIEREVKERYKVVNFLSNSFERWLTFEFSDRKTVYISFKTDKNNNVIEATTDEAVFHCYLPTIDKNVFPFKISSDFSTDPSRKHLVLDSETILSINEAAKALLKLLKDIFKDYDENYYDGILENLMKKNSFSKFNILFLEEFNKLVKEDSWLSLESGELINVTEYKKEPMWLEASEFDILTKYSNYLSERRVNSNVFIAVPNINRYLSSFSNQFFDHLDFIEVLKEEKVIMEINPYLHGKVFANVIKKTIMMYDLYKEVTSIDDILFYVSGELQCLKDLKSDDKLLILNVDFIQALEEILSTKELEHISKFYSIKISIPNNKELNKTVYKEQKIIKTGISKWRAAENQCIELEESLGYEAFDVSKQNLGYDILSKNKNGEARYIEVKSLKSRDSYFTLTNNEYSAAHQLGDQYFLCLIFQDENSFVAQYIFNPVKNLELVKRVRQWEWYCEEYQGIEYKMKFK